MLIKRSTLCKIKQQHTEIPQKGIFISEKKFGPTKDKCIEKLLLARTDDGPGPLPAIK
jgi:hypothetical protein